jgi:hypothetical protein
MRKPRLGLMFTLMFGVVWGLLPISARAADQAVVQALAGEDKAKESELTKDYQALQDSGLSKEDATNALVLQEQKVEEERRNAAQKEFLGTKWGMGIGVGVDFGGRTRVKSARVVGNLVRVEEENDITPRIFLETHNFLNRKVRGGEKKPTDALWGNGPFAALQSSTEEVIESFSIGYMWGFRTSPDSNAGLNFGIGVVLDPGVQMLGDGVEEGKPLADGDELRYKKESRVGLAIMTSFSF